ncbi:MAG: S-layer homology domain-containing protein [Clostridiales bacterium]|nr:MAG: S-layer homology domain-containing protein [Clostridiales bacterium]
MLLSAVTFEELEGTFDFDDVKSDDWYYDTVKKAYLCKIVNGMSDRMVGSGNAVSRQDMAVMCYNALIKKRALSRAVTHKIHLPTQTILRRMQKRRYRI